ncbi:MAG: D-alanine--poly(phosphoribitol) ligase [Candidatus Electrothrix sp. AU1_5]|nr:D-alanine--poly(phosphoribitol) ligase [Candidatus Electrothrix gigas]
MAYLLSQLLKQSVQAHAERPALTDGKRELTYRALDELSNRFAQQLLQAGVTRGDRVGIYLKKSPEAVAAIFGVLKIGAAYVPLDSAAPLQRIAYIVENCRIKALVSTRPKITKFQNRSSEIENKPTPILVDDQQALAAVPSEPLPDPQSIENDLAYILYTSGSTGMPKGVMISHRASLTFVDWAFDTFAVQPTDRISSHAPFHFDLSIFDIFVTMKAGGTLVLVPPTLSVFPRDLADFIASQKISIWYSVPSALIQMLLYGQLERHDFSRLRTVLFAGEVFPVKYLRQLMSRFPHIGYHNLYGPTETNVCTWHTVSPLAPDRSQPISIGKACANSEILVFNEQNELVASGETGELCVRGPGLMSGYWGLPERTAESLTHCRIHDLESEVIYHTGDLVRQEDDGNYTYLGRRDNQIKSRGYRIELGEIETVLYSHLAVEEAAVIPIPDEEIGNRIRAILVVRDGEQLTHSALDVFCATHLPKYMMPHEVEFRDSLPKTSTGKVDKVQLSQESTS